MSLPSAIHALAQLTPKSDQPTGLARISRLVNWRNRAKRELPRTELVGTPGPWVSVSECPPRQAHYHADEQSADRAVERLSSGCGGRGCRGDQGTLATGLAQHWTMPLED